MTEMARIDTAHQEGAEFPIRCTFYRCTLSASACIQRQTATKKGRGNGARELPLHPHCAEGSCETGQEMRSWFPDIEGPKVIAGGVWRRLKSKRPKKGQKGPTDA